MTSTSSDEVIDLETAKARVIDRMAKAEVAADRARIETDRAAEEQARVRERAESERRDREAKLQAETDAARARLAQLDTEGGQLVAALLTTFQERERLAIAYESAASQLRNVRGQESPRWGDRTLDDERGKFARTIKRILAGANVPVSGLFAWLDQRAVLFAATY